MTDPQPDPLVGAATTPEAAPTRLEPGMTAGEAAFALMRAQYEAMRIEEPAVRIGGDPDALHRMRVAIRRLRAALALFESALPVRAPVHRARLDRIGTTLGSVRDLDVQLAQVTTWAATASQADQEALAMVASALEERRSRARHRLIVELDSERSKRALGMFERFLAHGPVKRSKGARVRILDLAPELTEREFRKLVTIGDHVEAGASPDVLHALRIRCKRLRYAVEFFEPLYGKSARRYAKRLVAVQDVLGEHQDATVMAATLREIAVGRKPRLDPAAVLTLGVHIERCRERARTTRELFPDWYQQVSGRRWRKLIQAAEIARPRGHRRGRRERVSPEESVS